MRSLFATRQTWHLLKNKMNIGIAQINTTVGDLEGNRQLILDAYRELVDGGAELILYPELALCGYPPRDLLFKSRFVADCEASLKLIAAEIGTVPAVIGCIEKRPNNAKGHSLYNSAAWCENGEIQTTAQKSLLPCYDVFDEERYFEPAARPTYHQWKDLKVGLTICEDIWAHAETPNSRNYPTDPLEILKEEGIDLLLNLSASPWYQGKNEARERLLIHAAKRCNCPVVYCNSVGGNDELIFDGSSLLVTPEQQLAAGLHSFRAENRVLTIAQNTPENLPQYPERLAAVEQALVLGLRDYTIKSGFKRALIGLSGGIDSAVVCALAVKALGAKNVIGVALPSSISSEHSRQDARALAQNLDIEFHELSIAELVSSAETTLAPAFAGHPPDVTEENIQARARGLLLMALSNKFGALLLTTGNKSELAVGYCTLYGDMCGGLAVLSDQPKMDVYALARQINDSDERIPINTIEKPPSAELRPGQQDSDSLPPYPVLDDILRYYIEEGLSRAEIVACGHDADCVDAIVRKVDLNEYKRKQAAPGLKTSPLAFGVGRRIPIVQKYIN